MWISEWALKTDICGVFRKRGNLEQICRWRQSYMNGVMPKNAKDFLHFPAERKVEERFTPKSQRVRVTWRTFRFQVAGLHNCAAVGNPICHILLQQAQGTWWTWKIHARLLRRFRHGGLSKPAWTVPHQAPLRPWDSPGKNTRVACHFLLQRIFLTQGWIPHFLHCQADSLPLSHLRRSYYILPSLFALWSTFRWQSRFLTLEL